MTKPSPRRILMAEDNPHDHYLLLEAFSTERLDVDVQCVSDGNQLLSRLRGLRNSADNAFHLVLLDVNLPCLSAEEVLSILRSEHKTVDVPIVVLSSMVPDQQKHRLAELGVHTILSKPLDLDEYLELAKTLDSIIQNATS
jgi:CheY-like chemotaxis protein